jgi:hypothetical protein
LKYPGIPFLICTVLLSVFSLAGCSSQSFVTPTVQEIDGYPIPPTSVAYPVPGDQSSNSSQTQGFTPIKTYAIGDLPTSPEPDEPESGKGSISGILFSTTNHSGIPKTMFYLTPGVGENNDEVPPVITGPGNSDQIFSTDENGEFKINSLSPGTYYLVMSAPPYDWALGYIDTTPTLLKIKVEADSKINIGVIYIYWP